MSKAAVLTRGQFDAAVGEGVTLVDFWAEWCAPCRRMEPVLDALAKEYLGRAQVRTVNVDDEPDLAIQFEVEKIPTILLFKDGELKDRLVGVTTKDELALAIDEAVA